MRVFDVIVVSVMTRPRPEPSVAVFLNSIAAGRRDVALRVYRGLDYRIAAIRSAAGKEKQMSRRIEMNVELARLPADHEAARFSL